MTVYINPSAVTEEQVAELEKRGLEVRPMTSPALDKIARLERIIEKLQEKASEK